MQSKMDNQERQETVHKTEQRYTNKGNNKITELPTILQRESQNS